jgi:hypothetical protein
VLLLGALLRKTPVSLHVFRWRRKAMKLVEAAGIENVGYQHDKQQVSI